MTANFNGWGSLTTQGLYSDFIPDTVVSQYLFEDDTDTSTAIDDVGSNNANITGSTYSTNSRCGLFSINHDGVDDRLESQSTVDLYTLGSDASISFGGFIESDQDGDDFGGILSWGDSNDGVLLRETSNQYEVRVVSGGGGADDINSGTTTSTSGFDHVWANVTTTDVTIYVDNTQVATGSHSNDITAIGSKPLISGDLGAAGIHFGGRIDNATFADSTLTSSEIQTLIDQC